jgi:hypothetical protein
MKKGKINGYWILKTRQETPLQNDNTFRFELDNKCYTYFPEKPEIELLFFSNQTNECYQVGIKTINDQGVTEFDIIGWVQGKFNSNNNSIKLIESGKFSILPNGSLMIVESSSNYTCIQIWERTRREHTDLVLFVSKSMEELNK